MTEQALHRDEVRSEHEEHAAVRVPQVVEADVSDARLGPELDAVDRELANFCIGVLLAVPAALATADV